MEPRKPQPATRQEELDGEDDIYDKDNHGGSGDGTRCLQSDLLLGLKNMILLPKRLLIVALPLLPLVASGQSNGVREPPRPMVNHVATVQPDSVVGVTYDIPIYEAANNNAEEVKYFYYPPPVQLIATNKDELMATYSLRGGGTCDRNSEHCDDDLVEGIVLYVRKMPNAHGQIEDAVKELLPQQQGKQQHIQSLPARFWFSSYMSKYPRVDSGAGSIVSEYVRTDTTAGPWRETEPQPVYFAIKDKEQGDLFLRNLEHGPDRIVFNYSFEGVSVQQCIAYYESGNIDKTIMDEDRIAQPDGGEIKIVSMDRLSSIVKSVAKEATLVHRCNDRERQTLLHTLIGQEMAQEVGKVLDWSVARELLTHEDPRAYLANVTREVVNVEWRRDEDRNAIGESIDLSGGLEVGARIIGVDVDAGGRDEDVTFKEIVQDGGTANRLTGTFIEPKQVFIVREDSFSTFLSREHTFDLGHASPEDAHGTLTLGKGAWVPREAEDPFYVPYDEIQSLVSSIPQIKVCWFRWDRAGSGEHYFNLGHSGR